MDRIPNFRREITFANAAGGCPTCGPATTVFVCEPERPHPFSGDRFAHFQRHLNDPRKPCPTCRPMAHAEWMAAQAERVAA